RLASKQFAVVDAATPQDLVFQHPGMGTLRIFLHIAGHDCIAPAAYRHIQRRARFEGVGEASREPDALDEEFGLRRGFHASSTFTLPARVAVFFDVGRKRWPVHGPYYLLEIAEQISKSLSRLSAPNRVGLHTPSAG